ncbi:MAG: histidine kinase [Saprospiraceae bacterium]|nr:histidine kinase [Saprospiraceae bacterium]
MPNASVAESALSPERLQHLRQLCHSLGHWAFTDFEKARQVLQELSGQVTTDLPLDIQLSYHRYGAFLENQWNRFDAALEHARQLIALLEQRNDPLPLAEAWLEAAAPLLNRRDWPAVQECLDRARYHLQGIESARLHAQVACREGFLHLHLGNLRKALDALLESEKTLLGLDDNAQLPDYYMLALVTGGLGDLYERLDEKDKSLDAYRRVLPIVEEHGLRPRLAWHYLNAGRAALAQNDLSEARLCFENVAKFAGEGDLEAKAHALANLGILAFLENKPASAVWALFDEAARQIESPGKPADFTNLSRIESWRAELLLRIGNHEDAERHLLKAFELGEKGHDLHHLKQVAQALAAVSAQKEDFAEAFRWQHTATELAEKHFHELRDRERQELEARYELERSRQEAQMARLRVTGLQSRALRAQMNPHFLFNALNAIQGFITSGRNNEAETYLARFAKLMRQTLEYSAVEVVTLAQEIEFLNRYLELNRKLRFDSKLDFRIVPPPGADPDDLCIPTMIVQPFVENAIEHGLRPKKEGKLRIEFHLTDDENIVLCSIEDNGVGYNKGREKQLKTPEFQSHRSRGLEITRDRLTLLHQLRKTPATQFIRITDLADEVDNPNSGTRVEVLLPVLEEEN